jgi:HAD superfamily hydrolase (TIGR01490 family)
MAESKPSAEQPLAIFDVDGTLFRRGLLPALTRRLVNEGVFSERVRQELSEDYYAWVERRGSYDTYDRLVMDLFLRELEGVSVAQLQRCARVEVETHGRRVHMYTRDMAVRLKRAGYQLIAISGSPQEILDLFLKPLGFDRAWGTVLAQDARGRYTGEVLEDPFKNKRRVLEMFVREADVSLEGSVGMGDTLSDVGFLDVVRTPIAFNPNRDLFEVARQRSWSIVVERKDVIYNLQSRLEDPVLKDGTVWVG